MLAKIGRKKMKKILLICALFIGITAAGHAQSAPGKSDPVSKAKGLQKELKLSDKQTAKVADIYKESSSKFEAIKVKDHGETNKMLADIAPLRAATNKKIKAVLTPSQAVKYDHLVKNAKSSNLNGGWSDGWSNMAN